MFVGVLANFLIAIFIDIILHAQGVFPEMGTRMTDAQSAIAFSYRLLAAIVGGYLTARLAPNQPMKHAVILGSIGIVLSSMGLIMGADLGPIWYPASLVVISLPASWAGAKIYLRK